MSIASAASQILSNTLSALKVVRERARSSKDNDLKEHISTLYDNLLSLKEAVMQLAQENRELRVKIAELERPPREPQPELRQVGSCNFYFVGEKGPYCQACYDAEGKLTALSPQESWNRGIRRHCVLCKGVFYEKPMDTSPGFLGRRGGPQGWMGS